MRIGEWVVEPGLLQIRRGETIRRLEPIGMNLLLHLADRAPEVVARDEIFEVVWEGRAVVDETLSRAISVLRHALEDDARSPRYIETIPTRGYRLIAVVDRDGAGGAPPSTQTVLRLPRKNRLARLALLAVVLALPLASCSFPGHAGRRTRLHPRSPVRRSPSCHSATCPAIKRASSSRTDSPKSSFTTWPGSPV
jgi:DNA-binding winged helix-turn-helix (wHTH) protein